MQATVKNNFSIFLMSYKLLTPTILNNKKKWLLLRTAPDLGEAGLVIRCAGFAQKNLRFLLASLKKKSKTFFLAFLFKAAQAHKRKGGFALKTIFIYKFLRRSN
jgi:hypothetical protein